jgi:hypothetical protein
MLRSVAVVRTDVSEERVLSIIRVTNIGELETLAVTSNRNNLRLLVTANFSSAPIVVTLMMEAILSSETSVIRRATQRNPRRRLLQTQKSLCLK